MKYAALSALIFVFLQVGSVAGQTRSTYTPKCTEFSNGLSGANADGPAVTTNKQVRDFVLSHWEYKKPGCVLKILYMPSGPPPVKTRYTIIVNKTGSERLLIESFESQSQLARKQTAFSIRSVNDSNFVMLLDKHGKSITLL
jgi:hypothetical protein